MQLPKAKFACLEDVIFDVCQQVIQQNSADLGTWFPLTRMSPLEERHLLAPTCPRLISLGYCINMFLSARLSSHHFFAPVMQHVFACLSVKPSLLRSGNVSGIQLQPPPDSFSRALSLCLCCLQDKSEHQYQWVALVRALDHFRNGLEQTSSKEISCNIHMLTYAFGVSMQTDMSLTCMRLDDLPTIQ
jgi:hypothetical protein